MSRSLRPISRRARSAAADKHRVDDRLVAGAAADVAGDRLDHVVAARIGIGVEQRLGGDDHAGRAEAALGGEAVGEGALHRMRARRPSASPSDGDDALAVRRARPAIGRTARSSPSISTVQAPQVPWLQPTRVAGQLELVAQHVAEQRAGLDELRLLRGR